MFRPFRAVRPVSEKAAQVAALPYDVMNSEEARKMVEGKPYSFIHVDKAEVDLDPDTDIYSPEVYKKAAENLKKLSNDGICVKDTAPCFYIYRLTMNGRSQTGLVGCAGIDDYINNVIKKHEFTRADKEEDRVRHVDTCNANTGPIFLAYKKNDAIAETVSTWQASNEPVYDFTADSDVRHTVWVVDDKAVCEKINGLFAAVPSLYIADGHHRCASAVRVGKKRREQFPDYSTAEEFNFFLAVAFPENELAIMDYNRVIKDLNGYTVDGLIEKLSENFVVSEQASAVPYRPVKRHTFGMYTGGKWYCLEAKPGTFDEKDPVLCLDVSILQNNCISPVFGIDDPRTDSRIDFVGGIRGLEELERRANSDMVIAFSMYPTSLTELMDIADAGMVMPPKSTWFEPKLLSGLFIHELK
ncbi:MAG: DUF1015 family protein [Clostridia bacterium]|nr:DUF1015 family protein [Clostridia bacterium]